MRGLKRWRRASILKSSSCLAPRPHAKVLPSCKRLCPSAGSAVERRSGFGICTKRRKRNADRVSDIVKETTVDQEKPDADLNRRDLLAAGAVAAGGMLLAASGEATAAQVEDRGSNIQITQVRGLPAGKKAYVKIETNQGITGWGEVTGLVPSVAVALVESWRELLVRENPTRVEHLWQKIFRSHRDMRGGPFMTHCLSAVDMALWDITGKKWGVPVYRLLGGPLRDRVRLYPSA